MKPENNINISTNSKKGGFKKYIIAIIGLCLTGAVIIGYLNYNYLYMVHAYFFKLNNFNAGDQLYVSQQYYDDKDVSVLGALRLIRPLTIADIEKMNISAEKKSHLRSITDKSLKTYACLMIGYFSLDSVSKSRSGLIGTYIDKKIVDVQYTDKSRKVLLPDVVYVIKPNENVFNRERFYYGGVIPENYTLADSNIYVTPMQVSNKELVRFR